MLTITKQLTTTLPYQFLPSKSTDTAELLFFDIETTGFSPDTTSIYLIGCCYYKRDENNCMLIDHNHDCNDWKHNSFSNLFSSSGWQIIQWFADDYISEQLMLEKFIEFANHFQVLVHFNGSGFDIPYLKKKLAHYDMTFDFESFMHIDLYKKIFPYKKIFGLPNLKQKTIEAFLGLPRMDAFSGGELIQVYVNYMKHKFSHSTEMEEDYKKLLLHNEEDVSNLLKLTSILSYCDIFEELHTIENIFIDEKYLSIVFQLRNSIDITVQCQTHNVSLCAVGSSATLKIPLCHEELKYFYPNYKEYYYLPLEDTAIHKSVAEFVDKEYRVKAKAATCYTKKAGTFIPQFLESFEPAFKLEYKDKESYVEITDKFLNDSTKLSEYVNKILQYMVYCISKEK